jgi:hypothetical protein
VFIEVGLRDITDEKIGLTDATLSFSGSSNSLNYAFDFELFDEINTQESKWNKTGFHLLIVLAKKDTAKHFWPRLTKSAVKNQYIQIDWAKWVDEDEEGEEGDKGLGEFDPSKMSGFGGEGDHGKDESDSDDEGKFDS